MGAKYCSDRACVCLSTHIFQKSQFKLHSFFCACCLWPWLSLSLATMLCTTSDVDDVMFARRLSSVSSPMPVDKKWPMIIGKWYRMEM